LIIISYETEYLRGICLESYCAEEAIGGISARALHTFIADAEACETALELLNLVGKDAEVTLAAALFISIGSSYQLQLTPVGNSFNLDTQGRVDWSSVTRLKVLEIVQTQ
jgi:hypothetical protein